MILESEGQNAEKKDPELEEFDPLNKLGLGYKAYMRFQIFISAVLFLVSLMTLPLAFFYGKNY
jgi:hypothetical protein